MELIEIARKILEISINTTSSNSHLVQTVVEQRAAIDAAYTRLQPLLSTVRNNTEPIDGNLELANTVLDDLKSSAAALFQGCNEAQLQLANTREPAKALEELLIGRMFSIEDIVGQLNDLHTQFEEVTYSIGSTEPLPGYTVADGGQPYLAAPGTVFTPSLRVSVKTSAMTLSDPVDDVEITFPGFYITVIYGGRSDQYTLYVTRSDRHSPVADGCPHPHVSSAGVCLGTSGDAFYSAASKGLVYDAMRVVEGVLRNGYSRSGAYRLAKGFVDESQESRSDTCVLCGEAVGAHAVEFNDGLAHESCAAFHAPPAVDSGPAENGSSTCQKCGCHDELFDVDYINTSVPSGYRCCSDCVDILKAEYIARRNGGAFMCPNCSTTYAHSLVQENIVVLGYRNYTCVKCTEQLPNGRARVRQPDGVFVEMNIVPHVECTAHPASPIPAHLSH